MSGLERAQEPGCLMSFNSNDPSKSLRKKIVSIKRQKLAQGKVVNLADFRELKKAAEPHTILVVDDEEVMRNALKRILEREGYRVLLAEDGMELSKILEHNRMDMILLDVNLPWVDGYELCRMIKEHSVLRAVPLVLISGRKAKEDVEKGFAAGCNDYIGKPFDVEHLTKVINRSLQKSS